MKKRKAVEDEEQQQSPQDSHANPSKRIKKSLLPLKGLTIAVSAHQKSSTSSSSSSPASSSYNTISQECRDLGATVTGQVHKRVNFVICTDSAMEQNTQRVRKAMKWNIPIVKIDWIRQCKIQKVRVDYEPYVLSVVSSKSKKKEKKAMEVEEKNTSSSSRGTKRKLASATSREAAKDEDAADNEFSNNKKSKSRFKKGEEKDEDGFVAPNEAVGGENIGGWTEPVSYGCCCICHDNGTAKDCEWCKDAPCAS